MGSGVEVVNLIEADPTLPRWYWSMDDTVRPTDTSRSAARGGLGGSSPSLSRKGLEVRSHRGRSRHHRFVVPGTARHTGALLDHRDADAIQAVVLGERSLGVRGGYADSSTSSRESKSRDGWTRVTVRWDADGTTVHAGLVVLQWGPPKGGIVIGGDNKVAFGGLIDEVRVWNRRLSDEEPGRMMLATLLLSADPFLIERIDTPEGGGEVGGIDVDAQGRVWACFHHGEVCVLEDNTWRFCHGTA